MAVNRLFVLAVCGLAGCKLATEPRLVSIDPEYAYTDGCTAVTISGANLGDAADPATIGGEPIEAWTPATEDPDRPDHAQDIGFKYYGVSPANYDAGGTFVDVALTVDGETLRLDRGFYYLACPNDFLIESWGVGEAHDIGDRIDLGGCGIESDEISGGLYSPTTLTLVQPVRLTSDCRGASVHFDVPTVPDGTYYLSFEHSNGTVQGDLCDPSAGDTADTAAVPCEPITLVVDSVGGV